MTDDRRLIEEYLAIQPISVEASREKSAGPLSQAKNYLSQNPIQYAAATFHSAEQWRARPSD